MAWRSLQKSVSGFSECSLSMQGPCLQLGFPVEQLTCAFPLLGLELSSAFWILKMFFRAKELNYVVVFSALRTDTVQVE